jgi:hypothetical protein
MLSVYHDICNKDEHFNTLFENSINKMITLYLRSYSNCLQFVIDTDLVYDGVMPYLYNIHKKLKNSTIELFTYSICVIKHREVYCMITWSFYEDKCKFNILFGTEYSNDEFGIYVYGPNDDDDNETYIASEDIIR